MFISLLEVLSRYSCRLNLDLTFRFTNKNTAKGIEGIYLLTFVEIATSLVNFNMLVLYCLFLSSIFSFNDSKSLERYSVAVSINESAQSSFKIGV